jgi:hypothetical protein
MSARTKLRATLAVVAALLGLSAPAVAATWTSEAVPAGPGALGPARLTFDAQGRALLLFHGVPTASQPRFIGMATRAPGGGWTRLANLPDVGWGNAVALQYGATRVLFLSGQVASVGAYHRARYRLVVASGRSDGTGIGPWRALAPRENGFVATANHAGQALVLVYGGGTGLSAIERPAGRTFGKPRRLSPADAIAPAVAINARGDRIAAWIRKGRIEARVRTAGHGWGAAQHVAKPPSVANTSLNAAVTPTGSFVVTWAAADVRESGPTRLIAGAAQRRTGRGWRTDTLENATLPSDRTFAAEGALALPLVAPGNGAVTVVWTGVGVKAARLTSGGLRNVQLLAADGAVADAAVGPTGRAAVVWSQFDAQARARTFIATSAGPRGPFGAPDLLTPSDAIGIGGPAVGYQPLTGQAIAIVPIIEGTSGGYVAATQAP